MNININSGIKALSNVQLVERYKSLQKTLKSNFNDFNTILANELETVTTEIVKRGLVPDVATTSKAEMLDDLDTLI